MDVSREKITAPTIFDVISVRAKPTAESRADTPFQDCLLPPVPTKAKSEPKTEVKTERTKSSDEKSPNANVIERKRRPEKSSDVETSDQAEVKSVDESSATNVEPNAEPVVAEDDAAAAAGEPIVEEADQSDELPTDVFAVAVVVPAIVFVAPTAQPIINEVTTSETAVETVDAALLNPNAKDVPPEAVIHSTSEIATPIVPTESVAARGEQVAAEPVVAEPIDATKPVLQTEVQNSVEVIAPELKTTEQPTAKVEGTDAPQAATKKATVEEAEEPVEVIAATTESAPADVVVAPTTAAAPKDEERRSSDDSKKVVDKPEIEAEATSTPTESTGPRVEAPAPATVVPPPVEATLPAAKITSDATTKGSRKSSTVNSAISDARAPGTFLRGGPQAKTEEAKAGEINPARFLQRVVKAFQAAHDREGEVRLRLNPPELGALRIDVKVHDGVLSARLQAETAEARTLLMEHLPELRERLGEQGIKVERFEVDLMDQDAGGRSSQSHGEPMWDERSRESESARRTSSRKSIRIDGAESTSGPKTPIDPTRLNVII